MSEIYVCHYDYAAADKFYNIIIAICEFIHYLGFLLRYMLIYERHLVVDAHKTSPITTFHPE